MPILILSIWTMILCGVLFVVLMITANLRDDLEEGNGILSALALIIFTVILYFADYELFSRALNFIKGNPGTIIMHTIFYFGAGVVWSFYKWYRLIKKQKKIALEKIEECKKGDGHYYSIPSKPKPGDYLTTLTMWIAYWPFSAIWYLISNPFIDAASYLRSFFSDIYENIAHSSWKDVEKSISEMKNPNNQDHSK